MKQSKMYYLLRIIMGLSFYMLFTTAFLLVPVVMFFSLKRTSIKDGLVDDEA